MKVEVSDRNRSLCVCPECPTYGECSSDAGELLFCGVGKSACTMEQLGCLCPKCPVHSAYALSGTYYCVEGAA